MSFAAWNLSAGRSLRGCLITALFIALCGPSAPAQQDAAMPNPRIPLRSIASLSEKDAPASEEQMILRGVITYMVSDMGQNKRLYIQDQTGAVEIVASNPPQLGVGDEIEVQGAPHTVQQETVFQSSNLRLLWTGSDTVPLALRPSQAAEGDFNGRLVEIEGRLIERSESDGTMTLALEGENQFFAAKLVMGTLESKDVLSWLEPGIVLHVRGICSTPRNTGKAMPIGFTILLRSLEDVRTVRPAPWFNLLHVLELTPVLLLLGFAWHRMHIRDLNLRFRAVMAERSRIAREIHDTMAQDFSSVALQIEGAVESLKTRSKTDQSLRELALALRTARHCREQAHDSIIVLRALSQPGASLLETLNQSASVKAMGRNTSIRTALYGTPYPIKDEVSHQILRLGQEAIANVLHHARATEIVLTLRYGSKSLEFDVVDNGHGFDLEQAQSAHDGHFGLTGMRERSALIGAKLNIASRTGEGTRITMVIPRNTACPEQNGWRRLMGTTRLERM